jgi:hypothetical protein
MRQFEAPNGASRFDVDEEDILYYYIILVRVKSYLERLYRFIHLEAHFKTSEIGTSNQLSPLAAKQIAALYGESRKL